MQLRRSYLEVSHQLENANEEVRGLSLRLQENVSIEYWVTSPISFGDMRPHVSVICPVTKTESVANLLYSFLFYLISYGCGASKYTHTHKLFALIRKQINSKKILKSHTERIHRQRKYLVSCSRNLACSLNAEYNNSAVLLFCMFIVLP